MLNWTKSIVPWQWGKTPIFTLLQLQERQDRSKHRGNQTDWPCYKDPYRNMMYSLFFSSCTVSCFRLKWYILYLFFWAEKLKCSQIVVESNLPHLLNICTILKYLSMYILCYYIPHYIDSLHILHRLCIQNNIIGKLDIIKGHLCISRQVAQASYKWYL